MAKCPAPSNPISKKDTARLKKRVVVKDWKGKLVAQSWPAPRGRATAPRQREWIDKFTRVNKATKLAEPCAFEIASCLSPGTGWYYRDVLATAMYGKLISDGNEPKLKTPTANVNMTGTTPLAAGVLAQLVPDFAMWDNNQFWNALDPGKLTALSAGLYLVSFGVFFGGAGTTQAEQRVELRLNGAAQFANTWRVQQSANARTLSAMTLQYCHPGDYFELWAQMFSVACDARIMYWNLVAITPENLIA